MSDKKERDEKLYVEDEGEVVEERGWLPMWWTALFIGSVIWAIYYVIDTHFISDWSQAKQYQEEVALAKKANPEAAVKASLVDGVNPFRGKQDAIAKGKKHFESICAACHKADMTGLIGPSLVDDKWLHGSTDKEVFDVIMNGVDVSKAKLGKGPMPPHKNSLGAKKVLEVMAYIASKNPSLKAK